MVIRILICLVCGYLIGSVSSSILVSRCFYKKDVRTTGSGNAGAANVTRNFGWTAGALTFLGDFAKGLLAMLLGRWLQGTPGIAAAGAACLVGHCWPLYFHFKGGKAVSTGAAVALMIDWRLFMLCLIVFLLTALVTRIASAASMTAAATLAIGAFLFTKEVPLLVLGCFVFALVLVKHYSNVGRLLRGTEPEFKAGKPG